MIPTRAPTARSSAALPFAVGGSRHAPVTARVERSRAGRGWARDVGLVSLVSVVLYGVLCWHPLFSSYPRYVLSAKEMVEGGDWVVPHLSYVPYFEKPILTYWLAAASRLCFGASSAAIHLPSGLASLASVLCTYAFGRHLRSPAFGVFAALMLLFSAQFLVMSTMLTTDPLFAAWVLLGAYAFWRHERAPERGWKWLFWTALGLGWLTKGPLAMVFAVLSAGGYLALEGGWRAVLHGVRRLKPTRGLAWVALINLPWHVLAWQRDPRFLEMFYLRINLGGLHDGTVNHSGPIWFYGPTLLLSLMPWAFLATAALAVQIGSAVGGAVRARWRNLRSLDTPAGGEAKERVGAASRLYLASMVVFPLLFLSLSASKLETYLLPLLPGIVLLAADALWTRAERPPRWMRWSGTLQTLVLLGALAVLVAFFPKNLQLDRVPSGAMPWLVCGATLLIAGSAVSAVKLARGRLFAGMAVAAVGGAAGLAVVLLNVDRIFPDMNAQRLAREVAGLAGPADRIVLSEGCVQDYTIVLNLGRRPHILGDARELGMGHFTEVTPPDRPLPARLHEVNGESLPENDWLYTWPRLVEDWRGSERMWLFCKDTEVAKLRETRLPVHELGRARKVTLLSNQPLPPAVAQAGG